MKKLLFVIIVIWLIIPGARASAYTEPEQGSDNATDVIVWQGDTLNIDLSDVVEETAEQLFTFIVVAALATWAIMNKGWFLKLVVCPVLIVYGLRLAGGETLFYPLWVAGVVIAVIGTYFLYQQAALLAGLIRDKRGANG